MRAKDDDPDDNDQVYIEDIVCTHDAFELFPDLVELMGKPRCDLGRGEPDDLPSSRAQRVLGVFDEFTAQVVDLAERTNAQLDQLPPAHVERIWNEVLAGPWVKSQTRLDVAYVVTEMRSTHDRKDAQWRELFDVLIVVAAARSGYKYDQARGSMSLRAVVAKHLLGHFAPPLNGRLPAITAEDITFINGANEGVGVLFRLLHGIGYLQPGDKVVMVEPVYTQYLKAAKKLGLEVILIPATADNGWEPTREQIDACRRQLKNSSGRVKLGCFVNPSNPGQVAYSYETVEAIAELMREHQAVVIEDTVYHRFVTSGHFHSLWAALPEQTVLLDSMSKYFRVCGSRLGVLVVTQAANQKISDLLGLGQTANTPYGAAALGKTLNQHIALAKGPGPWGMMNHTTHMPRPQQLEAVVRLLVDPDSGIAFTKRLKERWDAFYHSLGLDTPEEIQRSRGKSASFVPYYILLDLLEIVERRASRDSAFTLLSQRMRSGQVRPWEVFRELAVMGVVVLPAASFFGDPVQHRWAFRASVANQPLAKVLTAGEILDEFLTRLAYRYTVEGGLDVA